MNLLIAQDLEEFGCRGFYDLKFSIIEHRAGSWCIQGA
jgi:hypothetical protein